MCPTSTEPGSRRRGRGYPAGDGAARIPPAGVDPVRSPGDGVGRAEGRREGRGDGSGGDAGVLLTASRLWTGTGDLIEDGAALVRDGLVVWAGPRAQAPAPAESARRIDHPGATILPGLIETHAHLSHGSPPLSRPTLATERHQVPWDVLSSLHTARVLASQGVTTVQSLGARHFTDVTLREAVDAGVVQAPRIVASGPQITTTGGHSWRNGGEVDSLDDIRHAVREHHKWGVDVVKVMATGGFMTEGSAPWNPQFSTEELRVLVGEAHRLGKHTAAHAHGTEGIRRSVEAGIDYIAHASFTGEDGVTAFDPYLADEIAERGTFVDVSAVPTFPPVEGEHFGARARQLWEHGVGIVTGNDIGAVLPPEGYLWALEQLASSGIPAREVLVAATSRAAASAGLAGVTGALLPGYDADLVVVGGNPLEDLADLHDLELVLQRGGEFIPEPFEAYEPPSGFGDPPARIVRMRSDREERARRHPLG